MRGVAREAAQLTVTLSQHAGRNKIKKDHHLRDLALNPDVQPAHIVHFEPETLREAFTLVPGQIPGFDAGTWEAEAETSKKKVSIELGLHLHRGRARDGPPADSSPMRRVAQKKKRKLDADGVDGPGSGAEGMGEGARKKKKQRKGDSNGAASP